MSTQELYNLPKGWRWTTLAEISLPVEKTNKAYQEDDTEFTYIDIESVDNSENVIQYPKNYPWRNAPSRAQQIIRENDILFSNVRPYLKNIAMVPRACNSAIASTGFCVIRPMIINPKFIFYFVTSQSFINRLSKYSKGTSYPSVTNNQILSQRIPVPSIQTQNSIIEKLDELFNDLSNSKSLLETAKRQLKAYEMVILKSAFEGKLTSEWRKNNTSISAIRSMRNSSGRKNTGLFRPGKTPQQVPLFQEEIKFDQHPVIKTWATSYLSEVVSIAARIGWKGLKKEEYTESGPLLVSVYCLNYGKQVDFRDANHISVHRYNESPDIKLRIDDVLLCKDGSGIGKVGIVKQLPGKATVNSSILILRGNSFFLPDFLYYLLKGPQLQELVSQRISGSAVPHLFQKDIRQFQLVIPPIEEQKEIVYEIEGRLTIAEKLSSAIEENLEKINVFKNVVLEKAFRGQLINGNDELESVEKILEQINDEKANNLIVQKQTFRKMPKKKSKQQESKSILEILQRAKKPISAKEVWLQSKYKDDIEGFYSELRLVQEQIAEIKRDTESLLSLKHEN